MNAASALADGTRVDILELLRAGPLPAGEVAAHFAVSRPAVSRHLRVLRETGLVRSELRGRERYYSLEKAPLRELAAWLQQFLSEDSWAARLDALDTEVQRTKHQRRTAAEENSA